MKPTDYCPQCLCMDCAKERHRRRGKLARSAALLALAVAMAGCGVACVYDTRRVADTPLPMYGVVERCEREVCRTPLRLPVSATITGSCL